MCSLVSIQQNEITVHILFLAFKSSENIFFFLEKERKGEADLL